MGTCKLIVKSVYPTVLVSSTLLVLLMSAHFVLMDGLPGLLLSVLGEDTAYALKYSNDGFRGIVNGMSEEAVVQVLGHPIERIPMKLLGDDTWSYRVPGADAVGWSYSRSPDSRNYRIRVVVFRNGVVISKIAESYFD